MRIGSCASAALALSSVAQGRGEQARSSCHGIPPSLCFLQVTQTSAKRASATPCSSSIFSFTGRSAFRPASGIDDVGDEARAFVELDQRDVVGKLLLERLVIGVVIDHPAHHTALARCLGPVPLGGEAFGAFGARRQPRVAALAAALEREPAWLERIPIGLRQRRRFGQRESSSLSAPGSGRVRGHDAALVRHDAGFGILHLIDRGAAHLAHALHHELQGPACRSRREARPTC